MSESQLSNDSLRESDQEQGLQEAIRRLPEFADLVEDVLLNTLQNLMTEAFLGEVLLTARPRTIALPPSSARKSPKCGSRKPSVGTAGIEKTTDPIFPSRPACRSSREVI
ncbi:hypothetical protein ANANG_G00280920 [Anguilla anguilla]|uniref:Uncharacterized protein n=1 Tax=Anguilla anguilla TaxID=7936 RepID=A0A9D3RKI5_ANGAN|nr:hypothetical protein ANANG_G00280920 [Anguilla anguilla]